MTMTSLARRRLGIDLDGVIADFNGGWTRRYNSEFGASISADDVVVWHAPVVLTHFASMSEFWRWAATSGDGASIFRVLDPFPGAIEAIERLAIDHCVVIVTTKPSFAIRDTFDWLEEHCVPADEVHIVDDKTLVDCDVYLDDADHNLQALRDARPSAAVCRFVRPWNRPHEGIADVRDWTEFERLVQRA